MVAAAIHVGMLPSDRIPSYIEIASVPYYDRTDSKFIGIPLFMGMDLQENRVYAMGMKNGEAMIERIMYQYLSSYGIAKSELIFADAFSTLSVITKLGGFISRRLQLVSLGRPLTIWGIMKNYGKLVKLVDDTKNKVLT